MTEQQIQKKIIDYLDTKGYTVKVMRANKNGTPDILACIDGRFVGVEVKSEKGRLAPLQELRLKQIREAGGIAIVARSVDDVRSVIDA